MNILIVSYGGGHVLLMLPIIEELKRNNINITYLALTAAAPVCDKEGIDHIKISDLISYTDPEVFKYGNLLLKDHHNPELGISVEDSIAYLGVSLGELVNEIGFDNAWKKYLTYGLNAFSPVKFCEKVLKSNKFDYVLTTESPRMERAFLKAASNLNIPHTCVLTLFPYKDIDFLANNLCPETVFVFSPAIKNYLQENGRAQESIYVVGNPAFESYLYLDKDKVRNETRLRMGVKNDEKLVLWLDRPELIDGKVVNKKIWSVIISECEKRDKFKSFIRYHPSTKNVVTDDNIIFDYISKDQSLPEALLAADIVISMTSTAGLESILLNRPTIIIKGTDEDNLVDISSKEGAYNVPSLEHLGSALNTFCADIKIPFELKLIRENYISQIPRQSLKTIFNIIIERYNAHKR